MRLSFLRAVKSAVPSAAAPKPAGAVALHSQRGVFVCWRGEANVAKRDLNLNACPRYLDATWWDLTSHTTRAE